MSAAEPRIAVTHDGNLNDKDDIGAIAMVQALIWRAGAQARLVHLGYSNHLGQHDAAQHAAMQESATAGVSLFGISPLVVKVDRGRKGILHLAGEIQKSTAEDPLMLIQAGPWAAMAKAFDHADTKSHQHVKIVSHSGWNDAHDDPTAGLNRDQFYAQYAGSEKWAGVTKPVYKKLPDQNATAWNTAGADAWSWLSGSPQTAFVLERTKAGKPGDFSDAGMVFWALTGNAAASMAAIRAFFGL